MDLPIDCYQCLFNCKPISYCEFYPSYKLRLKFITECGL